MSFDFQSIFDTEDPIYVHSNNSNFQNAFSGISFEEILSSIAKNLMGVIKSDIKMLERMEDEMVQKQIKKYKAAGVPAPFKDRDGFLEYFREFKKLMESNKDLSMYTFVTYKRSQESIKEVLVRGEEIKEKALNKIIDKNSKPVRREARKREEEKGRSLSKDEFEKVIIDVQNSYNDLSILMAEVVSILVTNLFKIYDPTQTEPPAPGDEKAAQRIFIALAGLIDVTQNLEEGNSPKRTRTKKEIEKDLLDYIKKEGPLKFLANFIESSKASRYFDSLVEKQLNSPLGTLFEPAVVDGMIQYIEKEVEDKLVPFFDTKKIKTKGSIASISRVSTVDFTFDDTKNEKTGFKTFFGASMKLIDPTREIKSETQARFLWDSLIRFVGKEKATQISYIRQNVLSLNTYAVDEEDDPIVFNLDKLRDFDKKIFTLLGAARLLIGFYEVLDGQARSLGFEDEFYFVVYIYETESIFRSTDILKFIVEELEQDFKSVLIKLNAGGKSLEQSANYNSPSKNSLEKLYQAKLKSMKNARKKSQQSTYKTLLNDNDVIQELTNINKFIGKHPFENVDQVITSTTLKKIRENFK